MDTSSSSSGSKNPIRRIDDAIFAVEQTIVWTFLAAMTVMVFLDVVYRRITSAESKFGEIIARIFSIENPDTLAMLHGTVAPVISTIVGVGLFWFGFWTAEQHKTESGGQASSAKPIVYALGATAFVAGLGWLMLQPNVPSKYFYLLLWSIGAVAYFVSLLRNKPEGWQTRFAAAAITTALFVWLSLKYFPDGYSWSKELSSILLIWVGFLGASVCAHEGKHIQMSALQKLVPESLEKWVRAGGFLVAAAFCALLALLGWNYLQEARELEGVFEQTNIPDWIATAAVPAAFLLTMLRYLGAAVSSVTGGSYGLPTKDEMDEMLEAAQQGAQTGGEA